MLQSNAHEVVLINMGCVNNRTVALTHARAIDALLRRHQNSPQRVLPFHALLVVVKPVTVVDQIGALQTTLAALALDLDPTWLLAMSLAILRLVDQRSVASRTHAET